MNDLDNELGQRLAALRAQGLHRLLRRVNSPQSARLELAGRSVLNFSSNDYLGLANESALKEAARQAVDRYGAGAGASRLLSGTMTPHQELEETLAAFKGTEAALTFATGYAAALGIIGSLLGKDDAIVLDRLAHACLVDAARLCGAKIRIFRHNDLEDLERILRWTRAGNIIGRVLVVTESLFSMDGDLAPLREIVELKDKYGAWLMVDEAHATGLYGPKRRGLAEHWKVGEQIEVQMGTLSKAIGASGGFICGSRLLIDYLTNRARTFIFSTAPVPAAAAAATAGISFVQSPAGAERCARLWQRVSAWHSAFPSFAHHWAQPTGTKPTFPSAIVPLHIGDESAAVETAAALLEQGIFVPAIRYPTVARRRARLRLTLTASHSEADLGELLSALERCRLQLQPSSL